MKILNRNPFPFKLFIIYIWLLLIIRDVYFLEVWEKEKGVRETKIHELNGDRKVAYVSFIIFMIKFYYLTI